MTEASVRALEHLRDFSTLKRYVFAIAGIVFYHVCPENRTERILGVPARWLWAVGFAAFCVLVECALMNVVGMGILGWRY
jgi:hypothetical protein